MTEKDNEKEVEDTFKDLASFWMKIHNETELYLKDFLFADNDGQKGRNLAAIIEQEEQRMLGTLND